MINSLVLQTYSPIIAPLSFIYGVNFVEKEILFNGYSSLGFLAMLLSFLLFYDRVETKKKEYLSSGLGFFLFSYFLMKYTNIFILSSIFLLVSLFLIGYGISDMGLYSYKNQYIYLSLLLIFISLVFLLPYQRDYMNAYNMSMLILTFAFTVLVFTCIDIPNV